MKKTTSQNGFTLIELIIVMVILGIMAAVAVPRYLDSIENAEASAEDAVISALRAGLKQYANNSLLTTGRAEWPGGPNVNPFDVLSEKPAGYIDAGRWAKNDGEWTWVLVNQTAGMESGYITHQRADNSRWMWDYTSGTAGGGDDAAIGTLSERKPLQ